MTSETLSRDQIASLYLEQLPYEPYPVQEEALLAWFTAEQGVLVCAPTGTGKTLIAEAALFEALHTGATAYYTTPLIALTDQKFQEMQEAAVRWGFRADDVGLVTGNRRVNPEARILVVVAEILFNRLLHPEVFDFQQVSTVVMDEFHHFNDPERGAVWELSLGLLPEHVRVLLLSATVGNAPEFVQWLRRAHNRRVALVQSDQRKTPLVYQWVPDLLLTEQVEAMAKGSEQERKTPALVFCFNRDECWRVAEQLRGKKLISGDQQAVLVRELEAHDWSQGAGPKLRQLLLRGVGVHHAGVLPKYRRIVEDLFQRKLLAVTVCTETLAAGVNLPARSVVLPALLKGPSGDKKLLEPSVAHQIFGRAGRPQYDSQGYVFALAHEDDVKILRWRRKYDAIPEDTKDPGLRRAKKALKRKMPTRRATEQYWSEAHFERLRRAPPDRLASRGPLPWRLLAYMLDASPEVDRVRELVGKRLMRPKRLEENQRTLERMLLTLWAAGYVTLEPPPPRRPERGAGGDGGPDQGEGDAAAEQAGGAPYRPRLARPTELLPRLLIFRSVNPLYGVFLINQLGAADRAERLQAMESVLEMPNTVARYVRVPPPDALPPGPLAATRLDVELLRLGLATPEQLGAGAGQEDEPPEERGRGWRMFEQERPRVLTLAEKLHLLFDYDFPHVHGLRVRPVWAAGELLEFRGDFNKYITSKGLQKQEGVIFRHLLRLILLLAEFRRLCPPDTDEDEWRGDLEDVADQLSECCRRVDPLSTDKVLERARLAETDAELDI